MISETVSILQMPWVFEIQGVVYTHRASQFGPATCQLLHSPTRFVATVLDHRSLEGFLKQMGVDGARQHWTGLFWRVWDPAGPHLTLNRLAVTKLFLPLGRLLHASFQVHRMPGTIQHQGKERGKMALQYWGPPGVLQDEKPGVLRVPPSPSLVVLPPRCPHFLKLPRFCTPGRSSKMPSTSGLTSCQLGLPALSEPQVSQDERL